MVKKSKSKLVLCKFPGHLYFFAFISGMKKLFRGFVDLFDALKYSIQVVDKLRTIHFLVFLSSPLDHVEQWKVCHVLYQEIKIFLSSLSSH